MPQPQDRAGARESWPLAAGLNAPKVKPRVYWVVPTPLTLLGKGKGEGKDNVYGQRGIRHNGGGNL